MNSFRGSILGASREFPAASRRAGRMWPNSAFGFIGCLSLCSILMTTLLVAEDKTRAADDPSKVERISERDLGKLFTLRYRWQNHAREATGEYSYSSEDQKMKLRLFSESLVAFYEIFIEADDLLSSKRLSLEQATKFADLHYELAVAKAKRNVERDRKYAKARAKKRAKRREANLEKRFKKKFKRETDLSVGARVHSKPMSGSETLDILALELAPFSEQLQQVALLNLKGQETAGRLVKLRSYSKTSGILSEFQEMETTIEKVRKGLAYRQREYDSILRDLAAGDLKDREVVDLAADVFLRLGRLQGKLDRIERLQEGFILDLERLAKVVEVDLASQADRLAEERGAELEHSQLRAEARAIRQAERRRKDAAGWVEASFVPDEEAQALIDQQDVEPVELTPNSGSSAPASSDGGEVPQRAGQIVDENNPKRDTLKVVLIASGMLVGLSGLYWLLMRRQGV